jgi:hypothetical protein
MTDRQETAEHRRLVEDKAGEAGWRTWGAYLAERAWGTVHEDYSYDGEPWTYFTYDQARSRVYRWHEDGLGGVCNRYQNLCLAVALWNEQDDHLKERLFGVSGPEGNHGEDVKELYFYLDGTPTHSYLKMLYKYPQVAFPYAELVAESGRRDYDDPEFEITDALAEAWDQGRYFDVTIEWAKVSPQDLLCRITAVNRGPEPAPLHVLPHLWARNTWAWGYNPARPEMRAVEPPQANVAAVYANERHIDARWWYVSVGGENAPDADAPALLFTENDTNKARLFDVKNDNPYVKDAFHAAVVDGQADRVNPEPRGTKIAAHAQAMIEPGQAFEVRVRFTDIRQDAPFDDFDTVFEQRQAEADAFYETIHLPNLDEDARRVQRQAWAGLIWTEQFYHYSVELWLDGDPGQPEPPPEYMRRRNTNWRNLYNLDVISMPDGWEYPWYAAWDLAFHAVPIAMFDPDFAKAQLILMLREWYQHPNGQIPAYEWSFDDVNPPVHAWAVWRVYHLAQDVTGEADTAFLERAFHKLLLNFTWWVNRKDHDENNVFQGGFLGLDNIGVFDRSKPLPTGGHIDQADGTAWMAMYCLTMLRIALELAKSKPAYEDVATKFFEHFIYISHALEDMGHQGVGIWDPEDGFYYDVLHLPNGNVVPLKIRSLVGLIPLFAVETLEPDLLDRLPNFRRRMDWFLKYRPHLVTNIAPLTRPGEDGRLLLALADQAKLTRVLKRMFDPDEFLSPYGIRSLSKYHEAHPYTFHADHQPYTVAYEPGVSRSGLFGGNSNWRGPVWFPTNYLMVESLRKYDLYYGEDLRVPYPAGSGETLRLSQAAEAISRRMAHLFTRSDDGRRPAHGDIPLFHEDPTCRDLVLFYEYFHGDTGAGLGASHQTGWTALVAKMIQECAGGETCVSSARDEHR